MTLTAAGQPAPDMAPPADAQPPAPAADAPAEPQRASTVGYTRKLWDAIQSADIHGNDALDALAQPPQAG